MSKYSFSGHESFHCKSLWLKKGYDYLMEGRSFTDANSVARLGVGKNMVSSIRFWLRAFGLTNMDEITECAHFLFNDEFGCDPFAEDLNTLWLLHFLIVHKNIASIYHIIFVDYQRERKEFTRDDLQTYIRRKCLALNQKNVYNENTVKKDIGVFLKNYVSPKDLKTIEDFSALLINLNLINLISSDTYRLREVSGEEIAPEIVLFALLTIGGKENTISLDGLHRLSLIFCLPMLTLIEVIRSLELTYPHAIVFSDNSGIKNVQFLCKLNKYEVLKKYYNSL